MAQATAPRQEHAAWRSGGDQRRLEALRRSTPGCGLAWLERMGRRSSGRRKLRGEEAREGVALGLGKKGDPGGGGGRGEDGEKKLGKKKVVGLLGRKGRKGEKEEHGEEKGGKRKKKRKKREKEKKERREKEEDAGRSGCAASLSAGMLVIEVLS